MFYDGGARSIQGRLPLEKQGGRGNGDGEHSPCTRMSGCLAMAPAHMPWSLAMYGPNAPGCRDSNDRLAGRSRHILVVDLKEMCASRWAGAG